MVRWVVEAGVQHDAALMRRAQEGDDAAFEALVARYAPAVERLARRIVGDAAADVAQQAFLSAWLGRASYDPCKGTVGSWLCRIAQHRAIDLLRAERRHTLVGPGHEELVELVCPEPGPAEQAVARTVAAEVRAAVARLGDEQRTVIELAYFHGLSHAEIQARTAAPLGTVKSRTRLGLQALRADVAAAA